MYSRQSSRANELQKCDMNRQKIANLQMVYEIIITSTWTVSGELYSSSEEIVLAFPSL